MAEAPVAERTLPHNLEAERSVLGADPAAQRRLQYSRRRSSTRAISSATRTAASSTRWCELAERGDAIDLVTLKEELDRSGDLDEVGGPAYIAALVDGVPRSTNVEHYARIIKEKATLRSLIFSANKILATAYEAEEEADVILDQAEQRDLRHRRRQGPRRVRVAEATWRRRASTPSRSCTRARSWSPACRPASPISTR